MAVNHKCFPVLHDIYLNRNMDQHEALSYADGAHYHSDITGMCDGFCLLYKWLRIINNSSQSWLYSLYLHETWV